MQRATISAGYLAQQRQLHGDPNYGVAGHWYARQIRELMRKFGTRSLTDYGAGKCGLKRGLDELGVTGFDYFPYDPAFPEYGPPKPADLVVCIDTLEHIEPDYLDAVLDELRDLTRGHGLFTVSTRAAKKVLPDGRNAHLIQQDRRWWEPRISVRFRIIQAGMIGSIQSEQQPLGFWMLVERR